MAVLTFIGKDGELIEQFRKTEYFGDLEVVTAKILNQKMVKDVVVISNETVSANELLEKRNNIEANYLFFIISRKNFSKITEDLLTENKIIVIPPMLTIHQIINKIYEMTAIGTPGKSNIYLFFGADSKVGTTMAAQSAAERLAENKKLKVFFLSLDGKSGTDYLDINFTNCIDDIRIKIANKILQINELVDTCQTKDNNLYILQGTKSIFERKRYQPEHIEFLLQLASSHFDITIVDAGNNIDLGMTIGALNCTGNKFLVTTQQEKSHRNFMQLEQQVLPRIGIKDFMLIINKYVENTALPEKYKLADKYNATFISSLPLLSYGWQCERDKHSLLLYKDKYYEDGINKIINIISKQCFNVSIRENKGTKPVFKLLAKTSAF